MHLIPFRQNTFGTINQIKESVYKAMMKHTLRVLLCQSNNFLYVTDEDECAVNNGGCSHKCLNTEGSYECVCPKGFKVQYNQRVCVGECIS